MATTLARRIGSLSLAVAITGLTGLRAQTLRTLTASGEPETPVRSACGQPIFKPASSPQSGPVVFIVSLCFEPDHSRSRFPPDTYLQHIHLKPSAPSRGQWISYDESAERAIFEDYRRLLDNLSLASLSIDIHDYRFENGVVGKIVT